MILQVPTQVQKKVTGDSQKPSWGGDGGESDFFGESGAGRSTLSHYMSEEGLSPEGCGAMATQATQHPLKTSAPERRPHMSASSRGPRTVLEPKVSKFNEVAKREVRCSFPVSSTTLSRVTQLSCPRDRPPHPPHADPVRAPHGARSEPRTYVSPAKTPHRGLVPMGAKAADSSRAGTIWLGEITTPS